MARCPNMAGCALFPLLSKPGYLRVWQISYCEADYTKCERYRKSLHGQHVPLTLLPNGKELAVLARLEPKKK